MIEIKDIKELKKYYDKKTNTYSFQDDVCFSINIDIDANINARDINARDIEYYAICVAYSTFKCKSLTGRRENAKAICLDSEIFVEKEEENATE